MKLQHLYEGKQDAVIKLIQRELWPIAKKLEVQTKSGIKSRPDVDGSVLAASKEKARDIINQYLGDNAEQHKRVIDKANHYTEVQSLLTNVLLKNMGHGVVRSPAKF